MPPGYHQSRYYGASHGLGHHKVTPRSNGNNGYVNTGGVSPRRGAEMNFQRLEQSLWQTELANARHKRLFNSLFNAKKVLNNAQLNLRVKNENLANRKSKANRRTNRAAQNPGNANARQEANRAVQKLANAQARLQRAKNKAAAAQQAYNRVRAETNRLTANAKKRAKETVNAERAKRAGARR
jgi:hypothetical protein